MQAKLDRAFYDILEIRRDADDNAIKKAYKKACLKYHPDKGGSKEVFQLVNEANQILGDPVSRADYDRDLKKYSLKDGLGHSTHQKHFKQAETQHKQRQEEEKQEEKKEAAKAAEAKRRADANKPVEIPANFETLPVKELKALLDALGAKRDDCFEKDDLINRVRETKKNGGKKPAGSSTNVGGGARNQESNFQKKPSTQNATYDFNFDDPCFEMPKPAHAFFKVISVGNQEAGKSCLIKRYCEGRFVKRYISTIGIDYGVKKLEIKGQKICINFFDLSGNDEYKVIRSEFYKDASGCIMVYDVDNRDSYISLVHWEDEMKRYGCDMTRMKVIVCGNKCESKNREVKEAEAKRWAQQRGWEYYETSASEGRNVTEAFEGLFATCLEQFREDKRKFGL